MDVFAAACVPRAWSLCVCVECGLWMDDTIFMLKIKMLKMCLAAGEPTAEGAQYFFCIFSNL